jgi:polyphosphate kinase 2 (PPK2 family)
MPHLADVDLSQSLSKQESAKRLVVLQQRLLHLRLITGGLLGTPKLGPPLCIVFEGWDAAGKGGAIKRLTSYLDPRHFTAQQFGAPSEEERRRHFLWRFDGDMPGWGEMAIFDRSWYGRVLVERVEGFATEDEWRRAYDEIVGFEASHVAEGMTLVKLWLHISDKEQLRRFEERRDDPLKSWKLTDEDWRNRSKRHDYELAADDAFKHTDHAKAHWDLVAAESKHFARVKVLETVISRMEEGMRRWGIEPPVSTGVDFGA